MNAAPETGGMALSALLAGVAPVQGEQDPTVLDIALDSREVTPGGCFFAVGGSRDDGIRYVRDAASRGAVAIVADAAGEAPAELGIPVVRVTSLRTHLGAIASRFFEDPSAALRVVAVTGTNGKTSVAHFAAQVLAALGVRCGYVGTLGVGEPNALASADLTTPDVISLHRRLAHLQAGGAEAVAMEASSHALAQGRLDAVRLRAACFTNLGHDHLDYHGDLERYANAKRTLFAHPGLGHAVLNVDDALGRELAGTLAADVRPWTVSSRGRAATVVARDVRCDTGGVCFVLECDGASAVVESPVLGRFNVDNLLAAGALALALGHEVPGVAQALAAVRPVPGRMEVCGTTPAGAQVIVDFAHTPDSLEAALEACATLAPRGVTVVFGCGGDRDTSKRSRMGAVAERLADRVILTADNPRSEDNAAIVADILEGMRAPEAVEVVHDRRAAIRAALTGAGRDDLVLVAGKGHEAHQQVGAARTPFSDRAEIRAVLAEQRS